MNLITNFLRINNGVFLIFVLQSALHSVEFESLSSDAYRLMDKITVKDGFSRVPVFPKPLQLLVLPGYYLLLMLGQACEY
jgi:hypothetical protein